MSMKVSCASTPSDVQVKSIANMFLDIWICMDSCRLPIVYPTVIQ